MPLISIKQLSPNTRLGLWRMTEKPEEFPEWFQEATKRFSSDARRREYVCVRALLREITGIRLPLINHTDNGRPLIEKGYISISHTRGYCTVIHSEDSPVGVDIEYMSDRVGRIAHRFLREDENAADTVCQLLHWSAKETIYKLFSDDRLSFEEMRVFPFMLGSSGTMSVCNCKRDICVDVGYEVTPDYVLTYSFSPVS